MPCVFYYRDLTVDPEVEDVSGPLRALHTFLPRDRKAVCEWNGRRTTDADRPRLVGAGDKLIIVEAPGDPISAIVALGTWLTATFTVPQLIFGALALLTTTYSIVSALTAKQNARISGRGDDFEDVRRFTGIQTSVGGGVPIPVIFGEVRTGGHIIESYNRPQYSYVFRNEAPEGVVFQRNPFGSDNSGTAIGAETLNTRIAWCWGPIESVTSLEIDDNPVENLAGMSTESVLGTIDQEQLEGFTEPRVEKDITQLITATDGAHIETTGVAVDAVEVQLTFTQGLFNVDNHGSFVNRDVQIKVELAPTGGAYVEIGTFTARNNTPSPMDVWFRLRSSTRGIKDVRITRVTADTTNDRIQDKFVWNTMIEERVGTHTHPGIAQTGFLQVPQSQTNVPKDYTALVRGLNDIRIYTTPTTYVESFTSNVSWCFLRWLTDRDFGLGRFYSYDDNVDIQAFIDWAEHCDDLVSDGLGGFETRCRLDWVMNREISVHQIREIFAKAGDADLIERGGYWTVVLHKDQPVSNLISPGSYRRDSLESTFLSAEEETPTLAGTFQNRNRNFREDSITAIDSGIDATLQSIPPETIVYRGVTRASQVKRSLLKSIQFSRIADEMIKVNVGLAGIGLRAGDIVQVGTPTGQHGIGGGRVVSVSDDQKSLVLDQDVTLDAAKSYDISVRHDPSIESLPIESPAATETTNVVTVTSPSWSERLIPGRVYTIGEVGLGKSLFRVLSRTLRDDYSTDLEMHKYAVGMFDVDLKMDVEPIVHTIADPRKPPGAVTDVNIRVEVIYGYAGSSGGTARYEVAHSVFFGWRAPDSIPVASSYDIYQRIKPSSPQSSDIAPFHVIHSGPGTSHIFQTSTGSDTAGITYEIKVVSVSHEGKKTVPDFTWEYFLPYG